MAYLQSVPESDTGIVAHPATKASWRSVLQGATYLGLHCTGPPVIIPYFKNSCLISTSPLTLQSLVTVNYSLCILKSRTVMLPGPACCLLNHQSSPASSRSPSGSVSQTCGHAPRQERNTVTRDPSHSLAALYSHINVKTPPLFRLLFFSSFLPVKNKHMSKQPTLIHRLSQPWDSLWHTGLISPFWTCANRGLKKVKDVAAGPRWDGNPWQVPGYIW